jgi:hypothetical protein
MNDARILFTRLRQTADNFWAAGFVAVRGHKGAYSFQTAQAEAARNATFATVLQDTGLQGVFS